MGVAVDIAKEHKAVIGMLFPVIFRQSKAVTVDLASTCHVTVVFCNAEDIIEYLGSRGTGYDHDD